MTMFERFVEVVHDAGLVYTAISPGTGPYLKQVQVIDHHGDKALFIFTPEGELSNTKYYERTREGPNGEEEG